MPQRGLKMKISERIKKFREEKEITQKELSDLTGIPLTTIQKYERGIFEPKLDNLKKLIHILDMNIRITGL